mgnify:CR=1 FL=1
MPLANCLILDLGNVIAFFDHMRACRRLADLSKQQLSETDVYQKIFSSGLEQEYDRGAISTETFLNSLQKQLQSHADREQIITAWSDIFWPNEAVIRAIRKLHMSSIRLVLASNTNDLHYRWIRTTFGEVMDCFDHQVLSYQVGASKPDVKFYESCLDASEREPSQCVFVDDRAAFVEAAQEFGMQGVVYGQDTDLERSLRTMGIEVEAC